MLALPTISADVTAAQALKLFEQAGWRRIGTGDWSWVLADTSDTWAARVTPFDPAYRMHAVACLTGPPNRWLPHIATIIPLHQNGYVVVMERLYPANEAAASAFCAALAIGNDSATYSLTEGRSTQPLTPTLRPFAPACLCCLRTAPDGFGSGAAPTFAQATSWLMHKDN
jgi:hypothetical protein